MGNFLSKIRQTYEEIIQKLKNSRFYVNGQYRLRQFRQQFIRLNSKRVQSPEASAVGEDEDQPIRPSGRIPKPYVHKSGRKIRPIRRFNRQRVYRLQGYTTVAKVNRKRQSERQQRFLRRLLVFIVSILLIILLFNLYNPIKDISEWYRFIGIKNLDDLFGSEATTSGATTKSATVATTATSGSTESTAPSETSAAG